MIGVGIGVGLGTPSELSRIIALLRSVGGSLYLPGPTNRVSADGSGVSALDGGVVGYVPNLAGGGNALTQATTANKPTLKRVPILGPELVVNGDFSNGTAGWALGQNWSVSSGVASCDGTTNNYLQKTKVFAANKTYHVGFTITSISSGTLAVRASTTSIGTPRAQAGAFVEVLTPTDSGGILNIIPSTGTIASVDNISVREILGYRDAYVWSFNGTTNSLAVSAVSQWADDLIVMGVIEQNAAGTARLFSMSPASGSGYIQASISSTQNFGLEFQDSTGVSVASALVGTKTSIGVAITGEFEYLSGVGRVYLNGSAGSTATVPKANPVTFSTMDLGKRLTFRENVTKGPLIILPGSAATNCTAEQRTTLRNWLNKYRDWMNA